MKKVSSEKIVQDIRLKTRRKFSSKEMSWHALLTLPSSPASSSIDSFLGAILWWMVLVISFQLGE